MTGTAWQRLSGLDAYRVTQIPRYPDDGPGPDPAARDTRRAQRSAVLTAAYHAAVSAAGAPVPVASAGCGPRRAAQCMSWSRARPCAAAPTN